MELKFSCNSCSHQGSWDLEVLAGRLNFTERLNLDEGPLDLRNVNQILGRFKCSKCGEKTFKVLGLDGTLMFDTTRNVDCDKCRSPIPLKRLEISPDTKLCTLCQTHVEQRIERQPRSPRVPVEISGDCPRCIQKKRDIKGKVVPNRNSETHEYFLGCSIYPYCHWTSNDYHEELNGHN